MAYKEYRIWCEDEAAQVFVWAETTPTECPNDAGHAIDSNSITVIGNSPSNSYCVLNFHTGTNPYVEVDSDSYVTIAAFRYCGSDIFPISRVEVIASRAGEVGESKYRLRDVTNNNSICSDTWTSEDQQKKKDSSLSNVPAGRAFFEVQVKVVNAGDSASRLWSLTICDEVDLSA